MAVNNITGENNVNKVNEVTKSITRFIMHTLYFFFTITFLFI
jgi:hypothetical protein